MKPPLTSDLPKTRTNFARAWTTTGVDMAGPIYYKIKPSSTQKGKRTHCEIENYYFILFTCFHTRAVHIAITKNQSAEEFQRVLKEFIVRRDQPSCIMSDNGGNFVSTAQWIKTLKRDDNLHNFLAHQGIEWKFNMSKAPWWGGLWERLIGLTKRALSKATGRALLTMDELKDTMLDVESFMNNRPLAYLGEEIEQPVLTPNILLKGPETQSQFVTPDLDNIHYEEENKVVTKRLQYLETIRSVLKKRWQNEYLKALQERHQRNLGSSQPIPTPNSVVMYSDENVVKPKWTLGRVLNHIVGKDGVIRGLVIKSVKGYEIQRPLQLIIPFEIPTESADSQTDSPKTEATAPVAEPPKRTRRRAATEAENLIVAQRLNEEAV